jgi:hypothetical protein
MPLPKGNGVQNPLNEIMPIKSWLKLKELDAIVHLKIQEMADSADEIGTLHFARFVDFKDHDQVGFFTAYDGKFTDYMNDFLKYLGPVFNTLNEMLVDPSPSPVEKNVEAWLQSTNDHQVEGIGFYSAYPTLTVQDIKARTGGGKGAIKGLKQSPLTLPFIAKSPNHLAAMIQVLSGSVPGFYQAADAIGTVHFARFLPLGTKGVVLVAEHDGTLDKLAQDLSAKLGPVFDQVFENVVDAPPTPVQKNVPAFVKWANDHNLKPWVFYSATPTLTVQDIRAKAIKAA